MTWSSDWTNASAASLTSPPSSWQPAEFDVSRPVESRPDSPESRAQLEARRRQDELEEAYQRGYEAGWTEASAAEAERLSGLARALDRAIADAKAAQASWVQDAREHIVALALAVARHVIGRETRTDPHIVIDLTRRALMHFPADEALRVRLHPQDLSALTLAALPEGGGLHVAPGRDVEWIADTTIEPGGCIVEGRQRVVDGRVDHALERIYQKLTDD